MEQTSNLDVRINSSEPPSKHPGRRMVCVPGGTFRMGSEDFYPEEGPVHRVAGDGFWMDRHQVANAQFASFVKETHYVFAARGGLDSAPFVWGDEQFPSGKPAAKTWQGEFPGQHPLQDKFEGMSPVGSFWPNGYGLYDGRGLCRIKLSRTLCLWAPIVFKSFSLRSYLAN